MSREAHKSACSHRQLVRGVVVTGKNTSEEGRRTCQRQDRRSNSVGGVNITGRYTHGVFENYFQQMAIYRLVRRTCGMRFELVDPSCSLSACCGHYWGLRVHQRMAVSFSPIILFDPFSRNAIERSRIGDPQKSTPPSAGWRTGALLF